MKKALQAALDDRGYTSLTPVQEAVLDPDLTGRDLLVSAQTGSGKTLGFGLAIAPTLLGEAEQFDRAQAPLALVIAPTRELALQVKRELAWLYGPAGAYMASCVGGMDMRDERRALARGAHIVVATPGRLRDHIMRETIDLSQVRAVVLDEADEMLDLGFREDLEFILAEAPETRQTLLFSATVPASIARLAQSYQKDAQRIVTKSETTQHADITYRAFVVGDRDTDNAVINTLLYHRAPNAIVFGNTRAMVNRLTTRLSNRGFQVVALSGELSQSERTHALQAMRDGRAQVCVATDVAARGIDLPNLDLVVHAELPNNHETLLHRSGRTGRAGRKGVSAVITTKKTLKKAQRILKFAKVTAEWGNAPSADEVHAREKERMMANDAWQTPVSEAEAETVGELTEAFTAEQLAAAYLRLYRSVRSAPEELSDIDATPKPREPFGPSVWFAISGGRAAGAEPRRLLPMVCKAGDLTKTDIGAIRVQDTLSYVEIKESSVAGFLAALGDAMTLEEGASIEQLAEPPVIAPSPRPAPRSGPRPGHRGDRGGDRGGDRPGGPKPRPNSRPNPGDRKDTHPKDGASARRFDPDAPKPAPRKPRSTPPTDWNDDPKPRDRKPKPGAKPKGGKPKYEGKPARDNSVHSAKGPGAKPAGAKPGAGKPGGPKSAAAKTGPKGPPPPKGKANSKKNKARRAMASQANQPPKRK
ncbi:DEAD/DEAH box helicase [Roseobacteraceae bacterium S113]